jgi:hypothetical protein
MSIMAKDFKVLGEYENRKKWKLAQND